MKSPRISPIISSPLSDVFSRLESAGSVSFPYIFSILSGIQLDEGEKERITNGVIAKIHDCLRHGNFGDLEGAEKVLELLNIEGLSIHEDVWQRIMQLYDMFNYGFLISLSPTLYNGRLGHFEGELYDRKNYTKKRLRDIGYTEDQITDTLVEDIWNFREIILKLQYKALYSKKFQSTLSLTRYVGTTVVNFLEMTQN